MKLLSSNQCQIFLLILCSSLTLYPATNSTAVTPEFYNAQTLGTTPPEVSRHKLLKVGVMIAHTIEQTQAQWQPTLEYLSQQIEGHTFQLVPLTSDDLSESVANKRVDFVLANASTYVQLEYLHGAQCLATLRNLKQGQPVTQYGAVIFRSRERNQDLKTLSDIKGKTFAKVSDEDSASSITSAHTLSEAGIDLQGDFSPINLETFSDVVMAVRDGKADVGAIGTSSLERLADEGKIELSDFVVISPNTSEQDTFPFVVSSQLYPEWAFATLPETPVELAEEVEIALLSIDPDDTAAQQGQYHSWTIPANYQNVHDLLKDLRIGPYENWGKVTLSQILYQYRYWLIFAATSICGLTYGAVRLAERRRTEQQLRLLNADLENRVQQRTAQLKNAKDQAEFASKQAEFSKLEAITAKVEAIVAKDKAEKASAAKSQFLANMSHELRTPLNGVLGYAQILQKDAQPQQAKGLRIIEQCGKYLLALIDEILDFSKSQANKIELVENQFRFHSFLEEVVGIVYFQAQQKNLQLKLKIRGNLPEAIRADSQRLRQILLNLLSNAVKFTHQGRVILQVSLIEFVTIRFEVIDTGVGISQQNIEKIFQPFEQVGDAASRRTGTGLGLAITYELVELMGSQLHLKSSLGEGSTFWFDLNLPVVELHSIETPSPFMPTLSPKVVAETAMMGIF